MLTHENLRSNAEALMAIWRFAAADALLHALPIFHTHGLFVATNITLLAGCRMLFLPRFEVDEVLDLLPEASVMMGVPTFYTRLLASPRLTAALTARMRLFISGSAPLAPEVHAQWRARTGHAILERYGMTETGMITSNPYDGERRAGTVGFPLPGVSLRIGEPATGRPLPQGEIGMIEVKGPNVFKGYWQQPDKTAAEFRSDGFFITGDLGMIDEQSYVHIVGRGKDLIITGGLNVYPREVENAIEEIRRRCRMCRHRHRSSRFWRGCDGARRAAGGRDIGRENGAGGAAWPARQVQAAEARPDRSWTAAQRHGQDREGCPAKGACRSLCGLISRLSETAENAGTPPWAKG